MKAEQFLKSDYFKYALIALGFLVVYKLLTSKKGGIFGGLFGGGQNEAKTELLELLEADNGGEIRAAATISSVKASQLATTIKSSWGVFNDDEQAIYGVFQQLRNTADLLLLVEAYGTYSPNPLHKGADLPTDLRNRMSSKEVEKINKILTERGINYAF